MRRHGDESIGAGILVILRDALADALAPHMDGLRDAEPVMPKGVEDRPADVWEPLLAIADAAGGEWPTLARAAASFLTLGRSTEPSRGVQLLTALHSIWQDNGNPDYLATADLLTALNAREQDPWPGMRAGQGIDPRGLASPLKKYGVESKTVRVGDGTAKGYARDHLIDPWERYCSLTLERGNRRHMGNDEIVEGEHRTRDVPDVTDVTQIRGKGSGGRCPVCRQPMDTAMAAMGYTAHPGCTPEGTA